MSAAYSDVEVTARGRSLVVRCRVRNRSAEVWRSSEGFRIGSQIIDPETFQRVQDILAARGRPRSAGGWHPFCSNVL